MITHPIPGLRLLVLDLDQTVRGNRAASWRPPNQLGEQFIYSGVSRILADYVDAGVTVKFATNQGGIGAGHVTAEQTEALLTETMDLLNEEIGRLLFDVDDVEYCPSMDKEDPNRKPNPGMLLEWAEYEGVDVDDDALAECWYIGDRKSDLAAAANAGFEFEWAWDFFGEGVPVRPEKKR
jgi:D-glycero-D-manno-heptose 1,7-bisphosphate phosphatase